MGMCIMAAKTGMMNGVWNMRLWDYLWGREDAGRILSRKWT